jgi:hypothetical protein
MANIKIKFRNRITDFCFDAVKFNYFQFWQKFYPDLSLRLAKSLSLCKMFYSIFCDEISQRVNEANESYR